VLMRSLRRLGIPTLIFVNKIDRTGARGDALLAEIRTKLGVGVVAVTAVREPGTRAARTISPPWAGTASQTLADHDDDLLAQLVDGGEPDPEHLRELLAAQTAAGHVHPVFFGSAITGEGTGRLATGIATLLRPRPVTDSRAAGLVFAVERGVAYLRLFSGVVRARQRLALHRTGPDGTVREIRGRVTALDVVGGAASELTAGAIGRIHGLAGIRVGDRLGAVDERVPPAQFSPPGLESLVRARDPAQQVRLHEALSALADEDPLIRTRAVPGGGTSVLLYGAVQREVLADRLARDFAVVAEFGEVRPVYVERVTGVGECVVAFDPRRGNDFWATVGLRVEPGPAGSGLRYRREVQPGAIPQAFHRATEEAVRRGVEQGLNGWEVIDCTVTVIRTGYRSPISTAADFRGLTPVVLLRALRAAGTRVCEPCQAFEVEVPAATLSAVLGRLGAMGADVTGSAERAAGWVVTGVLPARLMHELTAALPGLTHGEGALWSHPGPDRPLGGPAPQRARLDGNPLNYDEYLRSLSSGLPVSAP
jgi:ribosomal protection tetracycline resistance protein